MRRFPNQSLGVVALNFEQRELIEDFFIESSEDPAAIAYQERSQRWTTDCS